MIEFRTNQIRKNVVLIILESGKIEISSLKNGVIAFDQSFQTNSEQFIRSKWTATDSNKFITSDSQDNLYVWDIAKGITPFYSAQSKSGTILEIGQFASKPEIILTITDKNALVMWAQQLRRSGAGGSRRGVGRPGVWRAEFGPGRRAV